MVHGIMVGLLLWGAGRVLLRLVAPADEDPSVARIIRWALVLKLLAAPAYLYLIGRFYNDVGDYSLYHQQGELVAEQFRQGHFAVGVDVGPIVGLGATYVAVGAVYWVVGTSLTAGALVFSWLAFWGLYLFYRAARLALPELDPRRYCLLLFLLPTSLFWSSTIGKDALMLPALGLAALGAARILCRRKGGFLLLAGGIAATALVRPHVGLMLFVGVVVAYLVRPSRRGALADPVIRVVGAGVLIVGTLLLADRVAGYLSVDRLDIDAVDETLAEVSDETGSRSPFAGDDESGYESSFEPSGFRSPAEFPVAVVTVLFRPFPFEAENLPGLLASLEGVFLLGVAFASRRRIGRALRLWRQRPYTTVVIVYSLLFCYLFASIGNFGLLARQRAQLIPVVVVLLAVSTAADQRGRRRTAASHRVV